MVIFNSYVKLPEGNNQKWWISWDLTGKNGDDFRDLSMIAVIFYGI